MKQVFQDLSSGQTIIEDVPRPIRRKGSFLIQTTKTLISAGTERMVVDFGKSSLIQKAKSQPEKVKQAIEKVKSDGVIPTYQAIRSKLSQPLPMGYCNVGRALDCGLLPELDDIKVGDRVVSNGPHAECVSISKNLVAKIPDQVSDEEAVFAIPGAIALQGVRLIQPQVGEIYVVMGLGLIGLLTVQLLRSSGCRVIVSDFQQEKLQLARDFGAEIVDLSKGVDLVSEVKTLMGGEYGVDGVLITAATQSNQLVSDAAKVCRKRGKVVLVGVAGLDLNRNDFYQKEIQFQVSCSYGPGRYDPNYEEGGQDYPYAFVRWTEQRNMQAILYLLLEKKIQVRPLISHEYMIDNIGDAYRKFSEDDFYLGMIINYQENKDLESVLTDDVLLLYPDIKSNDSRNNKLGSAAVIGAGLYSGQIFLPALQKTNFFRHTLVSATGSNSQIFGKKFQFKYCSSNLDKAIESSECDSTFILTRHHQHAKLIKKSLEAGKNTFVEKPFCINLDELTDLYQFFKVISGQEVAPSFTVGYNRRFAPLVVQMKKLLQTIGGPKSINITINAGALPENHWLRDPMVGGGRLVGEGCHFIDLARFLIAKPITHAQINYLEGLAPGDTFNILLSFEDGSTAVISYLSNGHRSISKEKIEVFGNGKIIQMDNFRKLKGYGFKQKVDHKLWTQDKGHVDELKAFFNSITSTKVTPISMDELFEVSLVSLLLGQFTKGQHFFDIGHEKKTYLK